MTNDLEVNFLCGSIIFIERSPKYMIFRPTRQERDVLVPV